MTPKSNHSDLIGPEDFGGERGALEAIYNLDEETCSDWDTLLSQARVSNKCLNLNLILNKLLLEALQVQASLFRTYSWGQQKQPYMSQNMTRNLEKIWDKCFSLANKEGLA